MPFWAAHWAWVTTMQFPPTGELLTQHAPVWGGVQVVVVQAEPAPCQTPCEEAHWDSVTMLHVTEPLGLVMQQAPVVPVLEQPKAPHVVPGPRQTPPPAVHSA